MDVSRNLVATEEVRDCLVISFDACARADEVADDLAISVSTARRHLELLAERGWAVRGATHGPSGRFGAVDYTLTARGIEAHEGEEGF